MSTLTPRIDNLERNYIINGNFDFWQRGTSFSGITSNAQYFADRFNFTRGSSITGMTNSIAQTSDVPTLVQSGFKSNFGHIITTTAVATNLSSSDTTAGLTYHVEGHDLLSLIGKTVTLTFWVKSSVTGTYAMTFNRQFTDAYITTYTINSANTWEKKSISIYIDPAVSWATNSGQTNGRGLTMLWTLGAATTRTVGTLNQWLIGQNVSSANTATNTFCTTLNATWTIAQVMLEESTSNNAFIRAGRSLADELLLCQRYYETNPNQIAMYLPGSGTGYVGWSYPYKVTKRATPTLTVTDAPGNVNKITVITNNSGGQNPNQNVLVHVNGVDTHRLLFVDNSTAFGILYNFQADAEL